MNQPVPGQPLWPQASIQQILFVQTPEQSFIQRLDPTSYVIRLDGEGHLHIAPHPVEPPSPNPPQAILLYLPLPSLKRHAFRLLQPHGAGEGESSPWFVNGHPCSSRNLVHGDLIQLAQDLSLRYYTLPSSLDLATLQDLLELSHGEHWYETCLKILNSFSTALPNLTASTLETGLNHLALLTELTPELILELDLGGHLLYLNASARKHCPDLLEQGQAHPLFSGLQPGKTQEITLGQQRFLRTSQFDPVHRLIRIFARPCPETSLLPSPAQLPAASPQFQPTHRFPSPEASAQDYLTHLPQREALETNLQARLSETPSARVAVFLIDIDDLTQINDTLGYQGGDQILQALSTRFKKSLSAQTFFGRWAGDKFMMIASPSNFEQIHELAQTVMGCFEAPLRVNQHQICVTASLGIALAPEQGKEQSTLIEKAYTAVRRAKHQGKQRYQLYRNPSPMEPPTPWQEDLKFALERNQLSVHYQPIVNPQTGRILSLEALLRWQHPQYGLINPAQFIPLAEQTGAILSMGQWLLRTVCLQHQRWQRMGLPKLPVSINFSSRQLQQPQLRTKISQILEQTEFESRYLMIEVNEATLVEDLTHAPRIFWELVELGLRLCVDNFGQENSSFSRLQQLPIASLKTDRSLVKSLLEEEASRTVLEAILKLSKSLKLQLVVKGVENKEQLAWLRELQTQAVQGDFLYAAMPSFQITPILQKHFQHAV